MINLLAIHVQFDEGFLQEGRVHFSDGHRKHGETLTMGQAVK
jgi:hypothetical protein